MPARATAIPDHPSNRPKVCVVAAVPKRSRPPAANLTFRLPLTLIDRLKAIATTEENGVSAVTRRLVMAGLRVEEARAARTTRR